MEKWIFPTVLTYPELLQAIQNISESYAAKIQNMMSYH